MSKEVIIRLRDDLDQSINDVQTVEFSWAGKAYEIDLSVTNRTEFENVMACYVAAARPKKSRKKITVTVPKARPVKADDLAKRREIREWARRNGYAVSERGGIPSKVMDAWVAAHG